MPPFAIELDDRSLALARGGHVLSSAPSAVFDGTVAAPAGANAWKALRSRPMAVSTRHLSSVLTQRGLADRHEATIAKELQTLLARHPLTEGERIWIAAPAYAEAGGLGSFLGIARRLSLPVDGFVDSAAVTVSALGLERNAIVLELGLHHAAATAVDSDSGQARRRRSVSTDGGGFIELHSMWLDLVSKTMVNRTRFDPLHDAATEQQLFDELPSLARELATVGTATAVVSQGPERFEVALTRDQFAQAADSLFRAILGLVHQLRPAGTSLAMVMPRPVAELPGLREHFEQFVGCEVVVVPDGFAAAATSSLDLPRTSPDDTSVRLLRRLPLRAQKALIDGVSMDLLGKRRSSGSPPSHVLLDGRAYALSDGSLVVGRTPGSINSSHRTIALADGLAGVSRRHCTFVHDGAELILLDHSTFGTFVNGERVRERVRVHAGDHVRLGEPGVELALIAVGEVNAAPVPKD